MNRDESIRLFEKGKEAWNAWAADVSARQDDSDGWKAEAQADFSSHEFGNANFSGFMFPGRADFSESRFLGNSWFIGATVYGAADFKNATFDNEICFIKTTFMTTANFEGSSFNGDAQFGKTVFQDIADFRNAAFFGMANFNNCSFSEFVIITETTFHQYAMFHKIDFGDQVSFAESKFKGGATFEFSVFNASADFRDAKFEDLSTFANVQFKGDVAFGGFTGVTRFEHATFDGEARFTKGTFDQVVRFDDTTFNKGARFEDCTFRGGVAFSASCFAGYATFDRIECHGEVSFQGVEARSAFTMAGASFSRVPIFNQATFSEAPRLDNVRIQRANAKGIGRVSVWNRLKGSPDGRAGENWGKLKAQRGEAAVRWRSLRRLASQGHDHQREMLFFREEVLASRWISDMPWHAHFWFGLLYQLFSDFGRSLSRPILWWSFWWAGFSLVYLAFREKGAEADFARACSHLVIVEPWIASAGLSLHRNLPALSGLGDRIGEFRHSLFGASDACLPLEPSAVSFLGVLQSVVAAGLLFLVLLAIRNRFRIK